MTRLSTSRVKTMLGPALQISVSIEELSNPAEFDQAVRELAFRAPGPGVGVVLEGRAPIWGYGMLVHECHPAAWVAILDPRIGAVVVESHDQRVERGTVFEFTPLT